MFELNNILTYLPISGLDSLVDAESCENALKIVRELKEDLPLSKLRDDKKLKARLDEAEQIIMHDMEAFANAKKQ